MNLNFSWGALVLFGALHTLRLDTNDEKNIQSAFKAVHQIEPFPCQSTTKIPHGKIIYTHRNNSSGIVFSVTMACVANFRWWLNSFVAYIYFVHTLRTHAHLQTAHSHTPHTGIDAQTQTIRIHVNFKIEVSGVYEIRAYQIPIRHVECSLIVVEPWGT